MSSSGSLSRERKLYVYIKGKQVSAHPGERIFDPENRGYVERVIGDAIRRALERLGVEDLGISVAADVPITKRMLRGHFHILEPEPHALE